MAAYVHGAVSLPPAKVCWTDAHSDRALMGIWFDLRDEGIDEPSLTAALRKRGLVF